MACRVWQVLLWVLAAVEGGKEFKMAFIYSGEIADLGWTNRHNEGRIYAQKRLEAAAVDADVSSVQYENTDPGDVSAIYEELAIRNYSLVVATSFVFHDQTLAAARRYPNTNFVHISGFHSGPLNFITAFGKLYQARYLNGVAAALKTRTGRIGYVASIRMPEVYRNINAYQLGAQAANSSVTVVVLWIGTFYNPKLEVEAARRLMLLGCDVIAYHTDSREIPVFAHENGINSVASNGDVRRLVGESVLTSAYFDWGPLYYDLAWLAFTGNFTSPSTSHDLWYGYEHRVAVNAELSFEFPKKHIAVYQTEKSRLLGGWDPFCTPVRDQSGAQRNSGCMDRSALLGMDYTIQGVVEAGHVKHRGAVCGAGSRYEEVVDYANFGYTVKCHVCEAGYMSNFTDVVEGSRECTPCPAGTYSTANSSGCTLCPQGTFSGNVSGECIECPAGSTTSDEGSSSCFKTKDSGIPLSVIIAVAVVGSLFLVAIVAMYLKLTKESRERARLFDNNAVAESVAESIASMRLEELEYLFELKKPNRIQAAFLTIVTNLKEYRAYMDPALMRREDPVEESSDCSSNERPSCASGANSHSRNSHSRNSKGSKPRGSNVSNSLGSLGKGSSDRRMQYVEEQKELVRNKLAVSISERHITAAYLQLTGLTTLLEKQGTEMGAEVHTELIMMLQAAEKQHQAAIDRFMGDFVQVTWNAATRTTSPHTKAGDFLLDVKEKFASYATSLHQSPLLAMGSSTGKAFCGRMGSATMKSYNVVGSIAFRVSLLCKLNETYGTQILVDGRMADGMQRAKGFRHRMVDIVKIQEGLLKVLELQEKVAVDGKGEEWMYEMASSEKETPLDKAWSKVSHADIPGGLRELEVARASSPADKVLEGIRHRLTRFAAQYRGHEESNTYHQVYSLVTLPQKDD